jgi:lipopolysaccharide export system permease protein
MNLLQRYIIKEIIPLFILGNVLLVVFLLLEKLISLADLFFTKGVRLSLIIETIIFYLPSFLVITIPTATLMACLIGFGRMSSDSEITVMKSMGAGPVFFLKPALVIGALSVALSLLMSIYLMPAGSSMAIANITEMAQNISVKDMKEGELYDEVPGLLFYADKRERSNEFKRIVVIDKNTGTIITAAKGEVIPTNEAALVMNFDEGRIVAETEQESRTVIRFGKLAVNIPFDLEEKFNRRYEYFMNLTDLRKYFEENANYRFEFSKRFALPFSGFIMSILGMSLGIFFQRSGRSLGMPLSIGMTMVYYILFFVSLNLARSGSVNAFFSAWLANILFAFIAVFMAGRVLR